MSERIDPMLVGELNAICDAYARRNRLGKDDRQEVFDHLEDTLQGYLTGQTRVTSEDALLIARARLGDVRGVLTQLQPERANKICSWARLSVAITTAFLTVLVLPLTVLLLDPPAGGADATLRALRLLMLCFLLTESGVFLTARADMRSRWQRGVALAMVLPAIAVFCLMLINTSGNMLPTTTIGVVGAALVRGLALACLAGHGILALMLITPGKREPSLASQ